MAISTASNEAVIASTLWNQIAGLINGTSGYGQPVALTDMGSATWATNNAGSDASALWALTVRNRGTGGQGLRVLSSSGSSLLTVQDSGVLFAGALSLPTTTGIIESLETPLTNGLPVQSGNDYERVGISEGSTSPAAELLAPMLNYQRSVAHNGVDTTQAADYYYQSVRYGSLEQSILTCTGGSSTTIVKSSAGWTTNQFAGMQVDLVAGTGSGQRKIIASNTSDTITIDGTFSPVPVSGSTTFVVNKGGAVDLYAHTVYAYDASTAKPMNANHSTIAMGAFSKQAATATGTAFAGLFLADRDSSAGDAIGIEIDIVNNEASAAATYPTSPKSTIALNIASFGSDAGYAGTYNSLGILLQALGANDAMRTGMLFGANSVLTYGIDFSPLAAGSTTPKVIRLGSGHAIAAKDSGGTDVSIFEWTTGNTINLRSTSGVLFESNVLAEWARINSAGLAFAAAAAIQTTTAAGLTLKTNGTTRMEFGSGATIGVFGVTPSARASAYTQTYSTATKTHANATTTTLTAASGTADGTVDDVTGAHSQTILNNNFKEMATQINALIVDLANLKGVVNSIINDQRAYGWFQ